MLRLWLFLCLFSFWLCFVDRVIVEHEYDQPKKSKVGDGGDEKSKSEVKETRNQGIEETKTRMADDLSLRGRTTVRDLEI